MPIEFRESGTTGPSGNLGGAKLGSAASETKHQFYNVVDAAEAAAGSVKYRCLYIHNGEATDLVNGSYTITTQTPSPDTSIDIGLGTSAVNGTEQTIANEDAAPAGVTFQATPLTLPTIPAGQHKAVWWRRTVQAGAGSFTGDKPTTTAAGEV